MKIEKLDKLKQIKDLREVWPNEAKDFTPWLAEEENLAMLGEAIGIEMELTEKESAVGDFNVDILATEQDTGRKIIIENQLEETNHDHLGKLITYASGKNAAIVIWIVRKAKDEHRQAIEWLNLHTDDEAAFFLIEIELWQIGSSKYAAKFNIVERPNDWTRSIKKLDTLTPGEALKLDFWQSFNDYANSNAEFMKYFKPRKAQTWHWYDLSVGIGGVGVQFTVNTNNNHLTAGIVVYDSDHSLYESYKEMENEIQELLKRTDIAWKASQKSAKFSVDRTINLKDPSTWNEDFEWLCKQAILLRKFVKSHSK